MRTFRFGQNRGFARASTVREPGDYAVRGGIIDLFAPLGFGSRALVVAPPKTGKTTLIREAAESVLTGYPDGPQHVKWAITKVG